MERGFFSSGGIGVKQKKVANTAVADANNKKEHVDYVEGKSGTQSDGNIGKGVTPKPIGTTALSTESVSINVTDSPTTDLNNTYLVLSGPTSYANLVSGESTRKSLNFCTLITPTGNEADMVVPLQFIRAVSERFANLAYGFFLGKRVAYSVVANYVRNTWSKCGLVKSFLNSNPLISKKWDPDVNLFKVDVGNVSVWVKLHGVAMPAFSEDGLSAIATKLDTPLMLDSYTSDMCMQSWGKSSYVRAMIMLLADVELKETIVVARVAHGPKTGPDRPKPNRTETDFSQNTRQIWSDLFLIRMVQALVVKKQTEASRQKVSNSNPFDALNSVKNNDELCTNGVISKSAGKGSLNVAYGSYSNTPIIDKINKLERQMHDGKLIFVDDDGNPLVSTGNVDRESKVEVVFDELENLRASTSFKSETHRGYGTNSL
uniref:Uncharacterized protein n=1 Tax=Tanacetum cinerariifolium TaxID=118510 RepID=A0A6L2MTN9_TANCI|nr:hypothetical protein [Tanacetum cinerariifolium]